MKDLRVQDDQSDEAVQILERAISIQIRLDHFLFLRKSSLSSFSLDDTLLLEQLDKNIYSLQTLYFRQKKGCLF
jgi:hypothetical protein